MNKLKLILPSKKYLKSYQNFCRDFIKNGTTEEYRKGYEKQLISSKKPLFLNGYVMIVRALILKKEWCP